MHVELLGENRKNCMNMCQDFLKRSLKETQASFEDTTGDETRVYGY